MVKTGIKNWMLTPIYLFCLCLVKFRKTPAQPFNLAGGGCPIKEIRETWCPCQKCEKLQINFFISKNRSMYFSRSSPPWTIRQAANNHVIPFAPSHSQDKLKTHAQQRRGNPTHKENFVSHIYAMLFDLFSRSACNFLFKNIRSNHILFLSAPSAPH